MPRYCQRSHNRSHHNPRGVDNDSIARCMARECGCRAFIESLNSRAHRVEAMWRRFEMESRRGLDR